MSVVLEVHDFSLYLGVRLLSDRISMRLSREELLTLEGSNGVGKTTFLQAILGLHSHWTGSLRVYAKSISYLSQSAPTFETMSLVELMPLLVGYRAARAARIIAALELDADTERTALGLLAGGLLRRAQLALALCREHDLLLLDEPLAGVDPESRMLIRDVIREETRDGALIIVEHGLDATYDWRRKVKRVTLGTAHRS